MALTNCYTDLATLKQWLNINDANDDAILETVITTASRSIDAFTKRRFYLDSAASARTYRATTYNTIIADDFGSTTGFVLATDDDNDGVFETTWTSANYQLEPDGQGIRPYNVVRTLLNNYFPMYSSGRYGVQITARWGWPAVPAEITQATLIQASRLYKRKDSPEGILGFADFGAMQITPNDRDVVALCNPFRKLYAV